MEILTQLTIRGVHCVGTVIHDPDPVAMQQIRTIITEGLAQALAKLTAEED